MKNECPFCGGEEFYPAEDEGGYVRFMCCENCHATGPAFDIPQDCFEGCPEDKSLNEKALLAFTHPAHMLKDKVLISRDAARAALESIGSCSCRACNIARPALTAALEANP